MFLKDENYDYIHIGINILLYFICIITIIKRKKYTCISMRSPKLLITGNIGGFFVSIILILSKKKRFNDYIHLIINGFYYVFREMILLSFIMRCKRIIECCNIINNKDEDIKKFYQKRFLYKEDFYVKIMFALLIFFSIFLLIYGILSNNPITLYLLNKNENSKKINIYIWLIINFVEIIFLLSYAYIMFIKNVKQKIILELLVFIIIWFIYFNLVQYYIHSTYNNVIDIQNNKFTFYIYISIIILYINLFISGFFPIILSFCYHTSISFYFGQSSMNDLYLFLSNEECYKTFYHYLQKENPINLYYLKFYANVMLYKIKFLNGEDEESILNEFIYIYNEYFENANQNKFNSNIINSIRKNFQNNYNINESYFNDALLYAYKILESDFSKFKYSHTFEELEEFFNLQSYIHCKMCNTGLIKKF